MFPAHAGMNRPLPVVSSLAAYVPRTRGDEPGREYIILDDAAGMGGTIAELRFFIESNGGTVVNSSTLISGIFGARLPIRSTTITAIEKKFGRKDTEVLLHDFNTAGRIEALREKEGRYILVQSSLDSLRDKILTAAQDANISPDAWEVRRSLLSTLSDSQTTTGLSVEATEKSLIKQFGAFMKRALAKGKVVIHLTADDAPEGVKHMVAWHGGPHDHNKFSNENIGTGEGAAAYGYGLYFAGNKEVAEWYKDKLSDVRADKFAENKYLKGRYDSGSYRMGNVFAELTGTKENFNKEKQDALDFYHKLMASKIKRGKDTTYVENSISILNRLDYDKINKEASLAGGASSTKWSLPLKRINTCFGTSL